MHAFSPLLATLATNAFTSDRSADLCFCQRPSRHAIDRFSIALRDTLSRNSNDSSDSLPVAVNMSIAPPSAQVGVVGPSPASAPQQARPPQMQNAQMCPRGHKMKYLSSSPSWSCDMCSKTHRVNPRLRCNECDYDMCQDCSSGVRVQVVQDAKPNR